MFMKNTTTFTVLVNHTAECELETLFEIQLREESCLP